MPVLKLQRRKLDIPPLDVAAAGIAGREKVKTSLAAAQLAEQAQGIATGFLEKELEQRARVETTRDQAIVRQTASEFLRELDATPDEFFSKGGTKESLSADLESQFEDRVKQKLGQFSRTGLASDDLEVVMEQLRPQFQESIRSGAEQLQRKYLRNSVTVTLDSEAESVSGIGDVSRTQKNIDVILSENSDLFDIDETEIIKKRAQEKAAISGAEMSFALEPEKTAKNFLERKYSGIFDTQTEAGYINRASSEIRKIYNDLELTLEQSTVIQADDPRPANEKYSEMLLKVNDVETTLKNETPFLSKVLTGAELTTLSDNIRKTKETVQAKIDLYETGSAYLTGKLISPGFADPAAKAAIEEAASTELGILTELPWQLRQSEMFTSIKNAGGIPKAWLPFVTGALGPQSSPERFVEVSQLINRLSQADPRLVSEIPAESLRMSDLFTTFTEAGLPPSDAARTAIEMTQKSDPDALSSAYTSYFKSKDTKDDTNEAWLEENITSTFADDPDTIPVGMYSQFNDLVMGSYRRNGGNLDAARATALKQLQNSWGVTEFGGLKYMRFAPELTFGIPGVDNEWITQQLKTEISPITDIQDFDTESIELVPVFSADGSLGYMVYRYRPDESGLADPVENKNTGEPVIWTPDYSATSVLKEQEEKRERRKAEAAARNKALLEQEGVVLP